MNYADFDTALDETYEIYSAYREKRGYPPSVREMAAMLNLSLSATWKRLKRIEDRGVETRGEARYDSGRLTPEIRTFAYEMNRVFERKTPLRQQQFLKVMNSLLREFERKY